MTISSRYAIPPKILFSIILVKGDYFTLRLLENTKTLILRKCIVSILCEGQRERQQKQCADILLNSALLQSNLPYSGSILTTIREHIHFSISKILHFNSEVKYFLVGMTAMVPSIPTQIAHLQ